MKNVAKVSVGFLTVIGMTGCGLMSESNRPYPNFAEDGQYGYARFEGDAAGIREMGTMFAGVIREGKAPDNAATTPYWNHRMDQERTETIRKVATSKDANPHIGKILKDFLFPAQRSETNGTVPTLPADQVEPDTK